MSDDANRGQRIGSGPQRSVSGQLSAVQEQLIEFLVHDLKSPVASVLGAFAMLAERTDDATMQRMIGDGMHAARRLQRMIVDMLDLGRLESQDLSLDMGRFVITDLIDEAVAAVRPTIARTQIPVEVSLAADGEQVVQIDFDLMTRVLVNLLENALRFSPKGALVRITSEDTDEGLALYVDDQGIGVPTGWRDRIFEKFVQRVDSGAQRVGQGLGLAFSRMVCDAHQIEIGVRTSPMGGSRFLLRFPPSDTIQ